MATADSRPPEMAHRLEARKVFDSLGDDENEDKKSYRRYAHHLARACWHGGRVMLRQTSPEAEGIFDFILELHKACNGKWHTFLDYGMTQEDLDIWLEFAAMFLSGMGNYFVRTLALPKNAVSGRFLTSRLQEDGGRKVVPNISQHALRNMACISTAASEKLDRILSPLTAIQPATFGYPSNASQSSYYPGTERITNAEIEAVAKLMEAEKIAPENTRLQKLACRNIPASDSVAVFEILQASAETDRVPRVLPSVEIDGQGLATVYLRRGDHAVQMTKICAELTEAHKYAWTEEQRTALSQLIESFRTGDYEAFRSAQKTWVTDKSPRVEHCMGFLFGYRDPHGARAEWQAAAGIADSEETSKMRQLVDMSTALIRTLPWAKADENNGKGPFEPSDMDIPDFAIIHGE